MNTKLQFRVVEIGDLYLDTARKCSLSCAQHIQLASASREAGREITAAMHESIASLDAKQAATYAFIARPELRVTAKDIQEVA